MQDWCNDLKRRQDRSRRPILSRPLMILNSQMIPRCTTVSALREVPVSLSSSASLEASRRHEEMLTAVAETCGNRFKYYANSFILTHPFRVLHTRRNISLIVVDDSPADSITFLTMSQHEARSQ
jgi:hypothetical protein